MVCAVSSISSPEKLSWLKVYGSRPTFLVELLLLGPNLVSFASLAQFVAQDSLKQQHQ